MTAIKRNRTVRTDLDWLTRLISSWSGTSPARIELSVSLEDSQRPVLAQIMADDLMNLTVPLVARGRDAPAALRALVDECERHASRRGHTTSRSKTSVVLHCQACGGKCRANPSMRVPIVRCPHCSHPLTLESREDRKP